VSHRSPAPSSRSEGAHEPFVRAIRSHRLLVAIIFVLAVAVSVVLAETRTPTYQTASEVLVSPVQGGDTSYSGLPVVNDDSTDPVRPFQTAASLLSSRAAALTTAQTLRGSWTQKAVEDAIDVLPEGESDVINVTGSAGSAAGATRLTNTYTKAALSSHLTILRTQAKILVAQLVAQQKSLPAGDTADLTTIGGQLVALRAIVAGHDPNFSLLQAAPTPTAPSGTSKKLIVLLGALAGLIVAIGTATLVDRLNRRVRDEDEILVEYPLPVLARVPELPGALEPTGANPALIPPILQEAYRTLQVQLPRPSKGGCRTIMFTSPSPGDGKTSSAVNLALMLTAAGHEVVLIDFDLRKPDISHRLGRYTDFMEIIRSNAPLSKLLVPCQTGSRLRVISSNPMGDVTPLLEAVSRRLPEMLHVLGRVVDYVIIDTAPVGRVSDALRVAPLVDDIVLVSRVGNTDRTELRRSRELLERMGHPPTGILLVGAPAGTNLAYGYGYNTPRTESVSSSTADSVALVRSQREAPDLAPRAGERKR
jgi:capsular exopolysaccharide synthesis family protein